jgi:outer membrane immunogenic protein
MASATFTRALLASATLLGATQAMAAEPFNGPYIGAELGWQQDKARATVTTGGTTLGGSGNDDSFAIGGQIGYDFKVSPNFVIGAEGSFTTPGRTFGLTGRAGVLATPNTLVYAKGGWVNSRYDVEIGADSVRRNRDGWTIGGGVEQMLAQNVSARVEYRYSDFKSFNGTAGGNAFSVNPDRHQVMAGVNFRF